jgi:hypothetical protein
MTTTTPKLRLKSDARSSNKILKLGAAFCALLMAGVLASSPHGAAAAAGGSTLTSGQSLTLGQSLRTSGGFHLDLQSDGNLVLYDPNGQWLWASWTQGKPVGAAVMQSDGNFVIYDHNYQHALWNSRTWIYPGATLILQDDGNLVIYDNSGIHNSQHAPWNTGTQVHIVHYEGAWKNSIDGWEIDLAKCYAYDTKSSWETPCPSGYLEYHPVQTQGYLGLWSVSLTAYSANWNPRTRQLDVGANWDVTTGFFFSNHCSARAHFAGPSFQGSTLICDDTGAEQAIELAILVMELIR